MSTTPLYFNDLYKNEEIVPAKDQSKDKDGLQGGLDAIAQTFGIGKHTHIKKFPTGNGNNDSVSSDCSQSCTSDAKEKRRQQIEYRKVRMVLRQDRRAYLFYPEDKFK